MKVFVTGATGVLGLSAVAALLADGHDVTGLARNEEKARSLHECGASATIAHLFDLEEITAALDGFDAVCNLATHIPVGLAGLRRSAWKVNDKLRCEGSRVVVEAAKQAGVRRLVQESISSLYADGGDEWITEASPLAVTRAVEPAAVAESNATEFDTPWRAAVLLRFGQFVGEDAMTRWRLTQARSGHPVDMGDPDGWTHVVHPEDAGSAVSASLSAPAGVYNVGAEPVRRRDMTQVFAERVGRDELSGMPRLVVKMAGQRLEHLARSHRVSAGRFHEVTGWKPQRQVFDASWLALIHA